ncbi:MAG: hypothetical protein HAW60_00310 [Bdellovibrionales bacterium]|nr:hypothetical protein [Bdellovibrionales bacterium]
MKNIFLYFILINLIFNNSVFASNLKSTLQKTSSQRQVANFATLIKTSLEDKIKRPYSPINLSIMSFLNKKNTPTSEMGNLKLFNSEKYVAISIKGEIYKNLHHDINFWLNKYDKNKNKALIFLIDSPGGYANPIMEMDKTIDSQRLTTIVTGNALSAAAGLFFLGSQKIMLASTKLGFHASKLDGKQESAVDSFLLNKLFLENSKNLKNKKKWENFLLKIAMLGAFDSLKMTHYTAEELLDQKLIQKVSTPKIIIDRVWMSEKNLSLRCKKLFS